MATDLEEAAKKLKAARAPEEVFGLLDGSDRMAQLRIEFSALARMLHPDRHGGSAAAHDAMAMLNAFRDQAERKIAAGSWGKPSSTTTIAAGQTYVNIVPHAAGDISDVYLGDYGSGRRAVIKVARDPRDRDLVANEATVLRSLFEKTGKEAASFQRYLPVFIEETRLKVDGTDRAVNVFEHLEGSFTLTQVLERHGGQLDPRHVAWIWKRLLEGIDWVHRQGYVHSGINPDHVLVFPANHGVKILDWSYAAKAGGKIKAVSAGRRAFCAPEVFAKAPARPGFDLFAIAKCAVTMLGGDPTTGVLPPGAPRPYAGMIHACLLPDVHRYQDAFDLYQALKTHLRSMFGPATFVELTM